MSEKMREFLEKVDTLCYEYGYMIYPDKKWWASRNIDGTYKTIAIIGEDEVFELLRIDGDDIILEN